MELESANGDDNAPNGWWSIGAAIVSALASILTLVVMWRQTGIINKQADLMDAQNVIMVGQTAVMDSTLKETERSNKEQGEDTRKQMANQVLANSRQNDATNKLAGAAKESANAAEDTVRVMEATNRPYVFLNVINGFLYPSDVAFRVSELGNKAGPLDNIPSAKFDFINSGKSPAIITSISTRLCIYNSKEIPVNPNYEQCTIWLGEQIIMSDRRTEMFSGYVQNSGEITEEQAAALDAGTCCFFFYGIVRYEDPSGREYLTGFGLQAMGYDPRTTGKPRTFLAKSGKNYNYRK